MDTKTMAGCASNRLVRDGQRDNDFDVVPQRLLCCSYRNAYWTLIKMTDDNEARDTHRSPGGADSTVCPVESCVASSGNSTENWLLEETNWGQQMEGVKKRTRRHGSWVIMIPGWGRQQTLDSRPPLRLGV